MSGKAAVLICALVVVVVAFPVLGRFLKEEREAVEEQALPETNGTHDEQVHGTSTKEEEAVVPGPVMDQASFGQVRPGMSYQECVSVIGSKGEMLAAAECQATGMSEVYRWFDDSGTRQFTLGFRQGLLASKGFGLAPREARRRAGAPANRKSQMKAMGTEEVREMEGEVLAAGEDLVISLDEYERVREGMTYGECVSIIGAGVPMADGYQGQRNAVLHSPDSAETLNESYAWENPGQYRARIDFENGRVTAKRWERGPGGGGGTVRGSGRARPIR